MLKNRLIYVIVTMVLFLFIHLQEHHMTYIAFYVALIMPILSFGIAAFSKQYFSIYEKLSNDFMTKASKAKYTVTIQNRSFLPCSFAQIRFEACEVGLEVKSKERYFSLRPYRSHEFVFHINGIYRGLYEIGIKELVYYDFLGLFRFKMPTNEMSKLTIMPSIISIADLPISVTRQNHTSSKNHTQGEDYSNVAELRAFYLTDSYRQIHWKASAKKGKLISKNFHEEERNTVTFFIDNRRTSRDLLEFSEQEDKIMEMLVSAMFYCHRIGYFISMYTTDAKRVDFTTDFTHLYQEASRIKFHENSDLNVHLNVHLNSERIPMTLFIFISNLNDDLLMTLQSLVLIGNQITIFLSKKIHNDIIGNLKLLNVHFIFIDNVLKTP